MRSAVDLHDEASAEYDAAFDWYLERSPDAALRFDAEVERAIAEISKAPKRWAIGPSPPADICSGNFLLL